MRVPKVNKYTANRRSSGLFRKYFSITISIILICFVFLGAALILLVTNIWMEEKLDLLEENTKSFTDSTYKLLTSSYMSKNARGAIITVVSNLRAVSDAVDADIFIINSDGDIVFCQDLLDERGLLMDGDTCLVHSQYSIPEDIMNTVSRGKNYRYTGKMGGNLANDSFIVACPIIANEQFRGAIIATQTVEVSLIDYIFTIFRTFFIASLFAFLLAFVLVYILTYKLVKPLRQMSYAAKQYSNGDFSIRITAKPSKRSRYRTEIDDLTDSFNSMAQALSGLEMSRRSFVSNVSHELKTPMTTISGFIDGILDGTISGEDEGKYLKIVSDEVKRLSRLVTGMLNMSKLEEGKLDIKPTEFDISEMVFTTLLSFEQIIENKNVDVIGLDSFAENIVSADKDMINQVVYNLIDNAVKFTPEGGYIEVASKSDPEKAIIKIKNSGKGISSEETEKVFERFYKVDKSRSYDVKGAGLGLYLCKTIVEKHGGEISVRSEVDEYAEFIFTLPKR